MNFILSRYASLNGKTYLKTFNVLIVIFLTYIQYLYYVLVL